MLLSPSELAIRGDSDSLQAGTRACVTKVAYVFDVAVVAAAEPVM